MKIVMPIADRGSGFIEKSYKLPKPLIEVRGKHIIRWATDSISFARHRDMVFIALKGYDKKYGLGQKLRELYSDEITVLTVNGVTEGSACTVLLAKDLISTDEELIIFNTDQYFRAPIESAIKNLPADFSGLIPVFQSTNPKWSFAKIDAKSVVTQVAEKVPISTNATAGLYYFRKGKDFVWAAQQMIAKNIRHNNQFYVSPVYNELIARGDKILAVRIPRLWDLGSPERIEYFEKHYKQ